VICKRNIVPAVILAVVILLAAALRFHDLTKVGLWPDEFWSSVHLAAGRGTAIFDLPHGVLIDPPPKTLLDGAPPWWHVWTGLHGITHPPLYLILLRWWMDLFGPGDLSTRTFSVIASLAAIAVLYDILRQTVSSHAALIAAALMGLSPLQINLAQETRPYTLLAFFGLLAADAILRIERRGATPARLIGFALALIATALTHYFSLGALLAIFAYAIIRLHGPMRRRVIATIAAAALLVLICWGPFLWQQHREFFRQQDWSLDPYAPRSMPFIRAAALVANYLFGPSATELTWLAPCIVAYLLPIVLLRRSPSLLFWWLWIVAIIGQILAYDLINHARLLANVKYTSLAAVGLYALCATPLPSAKWWRWALAYMFLIGVAVAAAQRIQEGPPEDNGDWRGMAQTLNRMAGPRDPLVFYPSSFWGPSAMYYLAIAHYAPDANRPVMFLDKPADPAAQRQLAKFPRIWLIGPDVLDDTPRYLPGWNSTFSRGFPNSGTIAELEHRVK
jgi:Dolichyl-phosphate-mannose-protein mannosyltransferase